MPSSVVEDIKARLDIADIVSEKVVLKKAGKSLKGLCPFHVEKTPSFIVFPETGTWHCFGCGEGGDAFTFVMRSQNLEFGEALSILAARAGVELAPTQPGQKRIDEGLERLYAANEAASAYFRRMLEGPAGARAREYLERREISKDSIESFHLGFAPDAGAGLAHHMLQQGFGRDEVLRAGLVGESESGSLYDRFRGRVVFPIWDVVGKLVGFGGRSLAKEVQPKYLNTPQTPVFDKGGCLYAVDRARQEIRGSGRAVIVEGYADALMAHQHGFRNVVASLGTAVTERQISLLRRWATELCFALDPDTAGQEATARGLAVAMDALEHAATPVPTWRGYVEYVYQLKTNIKIIALPEGRDPDELIRQDRSAWERLVREAVPVQDFFLERVRRKHDLTTASGKASAVEEAMGMIGVIPDPVQQAHYVQRLASMVGIEEAILLQQVRRPRQRRAVGTGTEPANVGPPPIADVEAYCLALLLKEPGLGKLDPELKEEQFANPAYREIFRRVKEREAVDAGDLADQIKDGLAEPLIEGLSGLLELQVRYPVHFEAPLDKAYSSVAVALLLRSLSVRKRELEAMRLDGEAAGVEDMVQLARIETQIARESHRLKLLGGTLPLRAIHKEVRHGR